MLQRKTTLPRPLVQLADGLSMGQMTKSAVRSLTGQAVDITNQAAESAWPAPDLGAFFRVSYHDMVLLIDSCPQSRPATQNSLRMQAQLSATLPPLGMDPM